MAAAIPHGVSWPPAVVSTFWMARCSVIDPPKVVGRSLRPLVCSGTLVGIHDVRQFAPPIVAVDPSKETSGHVDNVPVSLYAVEHLQSWPHCVIRCISGP